MKELVIYIDSGYISARGENIIDCVNSIEQNIGIDDYQYYIVCSESHPENTRQIYEMLIKDKIYKLVEQKEYGSWADNFNMFVEDCKDEFRVLMETHDDLAIDTKDFYKVYLEETKDIQEDKLGWSSFTNVGYYKQDLCWSNSMRFGVHKDRFARRFGFEAHTKDINNLDWPKKTCVVWAPFHHVCLIPMKNVLEFYPLTTFCNWSVLADEDFCLESLTHDMINLWIPQVEYQHPLRVEGRKHKTQKTSHLRIPTLAEKNFGKKWNVTWGHDITPPVRNYTDDDVQSLIKQFPNSNIKMFSEKYSYEYIYLEDYLKEK